MSTLNSEPAKNDAKTSQVYIETREVWKDQDESCDATETAEGGEQSEHQLPIQVHLPLALLHDTCNLSPHVDEIPYQLMAPPCAGNRDGKHKHYWKIVHDVRHEKDDA